MYPILLLAGYTQYHHRSPLYASGSILQSFLFFIPAFFKGLKNVSLKNKAHVGWLKKLRYAVLPLLIATVFFITYKMANKVFADITDKIGVQIGQWMIGLLDWVSPERLVFVLLGLWITGGLLIRYIKAPLEAKEELENNRLERKRTVVKRETPSLSQDMKQFFLGKQAIGNMALKYEYKVGVLSLAILNLILLFVNISDILYVWLGRKYTADMDWVEYVHSGAEMLVLSIVLAMVVVLFFFRANLNFFRRSKLLKTIAYIWIFQNSFLALSVCIRNYHYIMQMGLTYKRIGLFAYALLVLIGLTFIALKIKNRKSGYYLVSSNAMATYISLIIASFFQWDAIIATYNLSNRGRTPVDMHFLLRLGDHALPVLEKNRDFITQEQKNITDASGLSDSNYLDIRIANYINENKQYNWLSWNLADASAIRALSTTPPAVSTITK